MPEYALMSGGTARFKRVPLLTFLMDSNKQTKQEHIQVLIDKGASEMMIVNEVGCSKATIHKVKKGGKLRLTKHEEKLLRDREEKIRRETERTREVDEALAFDKVLIPAIVKKMDSEFVFESTVKLIVQYYEMPIYVDRSFPSVNDAYARHWYFEKEKQKQAAH